MRRLILARAAALGLLGLTVTFYGIALAADGDALTATFTVWDENPSTPSFTNSVKNQSHTNPRQWRITNTVCNNNQLHHLMYYKWTVDTAQITNWNKSPIGPLGKTDTTTVACIGEPTQSSGGQIVAKVVDDQGGGEKQISTQAERWMPVKNVAALAGDSVFVVYDAEGTSLFSITSEVIDAGNGTLYVSTSFSNSTNDDADFYVGSATNPYFVPAQGSYDSQSGDVDALMQDIVQYRVVFAPGTAAQYEIVVDGPILVASP